MPISQQKKPEYIIVFSKPAERNIELVRSLTEGAHLHSVAARPSVMVAESKKHSQANTTLYKRLAVATSDLKTNELKTLENDPAVLTVLKNELRHLPKPVVAGQQDTSAAPVKQIGAYLEGLIDAARMLQGFMQHNAMQSSYPLSREIAGAAADKHSHFWALQQVGLSPSYQNYTGKGIKVAVLDTGIDLTHPDFSGKLKEGVNAVSFVAGETVQDGNGHGTHCAGTIGALAQSAGDIRYSVAPDCELLVAKVLSNAGSGMDSDILDGIAWAVENGARIISMSLGSFRSSGQNYYQAYEAIAKNMWNDSDGALLVAAAGNDSYRPHYTCAVANPAAAPSFMAVAAIDQAKNVAYFSNCKTDNIGEIAVSAPGVNVYSAWTGGQFATISGTSMATPHVAGVAALYLQQNSSLSPKALWQKIQQQCISLGNTDDYGAGLVQVP